MKIKKWEKRIAGTFACADHKFASHPSEVKRARQMFSAAIKERVGYKEFRSAVRKWFVENVPRTAQNKALHADLLKDTMKKIRGLKPFFDYD